MTATLPASVGRLRVPAHRASSATLAHAYPYLLPLTPRAGVPIGVEVLSGSVFSFDPWACYQAGSVTNPNMLLAGVLGVGKSALAKSLALRAIAAGRRVLVPGDAKGEWGVVAHAVGGHVLTLTPGGRVRINPLDVTGEDQGAERARRVAMIAATTLRRDLTPAELAAVHAATTTAATPTLGAVLDALLRPDPRLAADDAISVPQRVDDGREVAHGLRRLVRGDLAGMVDGPSPLAPDPTSPMLVVDLSRLGHDDDAVAVVTACTSAWLDTATPNVGHRWVIYDEAWRLLAQPAITRALQARWKLARSTGIANLLILHRLSDLDAVGPAGSTHRALAEGLLADCSTRVIYRQEADQLDALTATLGLYEAERVVLPALPRGSGLWRFPTASHLVQHRLTAAERRLVDTDAAMREEVAS